MSTTFTHRQARALLPSRPSSEARAETKQPDQPAPSISTLAWLSLHDLVDDGHFKAMAAAHRTIDDTDEVDSLLSRARFLINHVSLNKLHACGLINDAQQALAHAEVPGNISFASPASAMMWLRLHNIVCESQWLDLRERIELARHRGEAPPWAVIFQEADALLSQAEPALNLVAQRAFWLQLLPGHPALWLGGMALLLAAFVAYLALPQATVW